ncbi:MAG: nucleoside kinase [Oscillospiraceae bacterium]|nr:nucleoside kinase [Oscillospiraceae bacterium]MCL2227766.1 nucleoside kinase [Oscillospiraceae bacterium]
MPFPYDIEAINSRIVSDQKGFAQECEAIYSRKVMEAAAMIKERTPLSSVVLLSGPSGSGKTTTAHKICTALEKIGICAITVSLDKYYLPFDPEASPKTDDGEFDRESPHCLDLEMLNEHFYALDRGDEVIVPHFNFKIQDRDHAKAKPFRLAEGEIVIFEGIHALNDMLADAHPKAFKLYISARSDIECGGAIWFKRTWTRLLRRIVRDELFRGTDASETLKMWANVRHGEKKFISPFKHKADLLFDSSMPYEVPVMKQFALKALNVVPDGIERLEELRNLLPALEKFEEVDPALVPTDSILREFIGGGMYKY